MAVTGSDATDAQSAQVPPVLRRFAQTECDEVHKIERFGDDTPATGRGWVLTAEHIPFHHMPDGFEATGSSGSGRIPGATRVYIRPTDRE